MIMAGLATTNSFLVTETQTNTKGKIKCFFSMLLMCYCSSLLNIKKKKYFVVKQKHSLQPDTADWSSPGGGHSVSWVFFVLYSVTPNKPEELTEKEKLWFKHLFSVAVLSLLSSRFCWVILHWKCYWNKNMWKIEKWWKEVFVGTDDRSQIFKNLTQTTNCYLLKKRENKLRRNHRHTFYKCNRTSRNDGTSRKDKRWFVSDATFIIYSSWD